jgi:hypothetical protein
MKRWIALALAAVLLLSGCSLGRDRFQDSVTFYYPRAHETADQLDKFFTEGAIGEETREAVGHRQDLNYLLSMYLTGPLHEELTAPYPVTTRLSNHQLDGDVLNVILTVNSDRPTDLDWTLGSACLAKTAMALTAVSTVSVQIVDRVGETLYTGSFDGTNVLLEDGFTAPTETTEATQ